MKRVLAVLAGAGFLMVVVGGTAVTGAEEPLAPEAKVAAGDSSLVLTWSPPDERIASAPAAAPSQSSLEFVAFSTPCRFMDTKVAGGAFAANESRDYRLLDADLAPSFGPCGVPDRAKAVLVQLAVYRGTPTATGTARLGPGGVNPAMITLQFEKGKGAAGTVFAALDANSQLRLRSVNAGADYVGYLLGFYQAPVWGQVSSDGILTAGSGVVSITKSASFLGDYTVAFDRPVSPGCAAVATPQSAGVRIFAQPESSNSWFFDARNYATFAEADGSFSFILQCS